MAANYTAIVQRDGEWWIGWVEEVPGVNSQGQSREELLENLRDALEEALEMNRAERGPPRAASSRKWASPCEASRTARTLTPARLRLVREGRRHSWWGNPVNGQRSSVPRHSEIPDPLCRKICRDLGIPPP